jgi:hypothetical protein
MRPAIGKKGNSLPTSVSRDIRGNSSFLFAEEEILMSLVREFWDFMKVRKKFWLAPIIIVLVILSGFIILASLSPAAAPFIYTLF